MESRLAYFRCRHLSESTAISPQIDSRCTGRQVNRSTLNHRLEIRGFTASLVTLCSPRSARWMRRSSSRATATQKSIVNPSRVVKEFWITNMKRLYPRPNLLPVKLGVIAELRTQECFMQLGHSIPTSTHELSPLSTARICYYE
jgi:hypothetical protein